MSQLVRTADMLPAVGTPVDRPARPVAWADDDAVQGCVGNCASAAAKEYWERGHWVDKASAAKLRHPLYSQAALDDARTNALRDAARWVDEEVGHALQDGWSVEAVQALMATRDMLRAHADMHSTTIPGAHCLDDKDLSHL